MGSKEETLHGWKKLLEHGVNVKLVLPSAATDGTSLLRCSVSAANSAEQINAIIKAFSA
jgi:8-amino-7-oxononanoate synthase